jgi:hypothetical protein
VIVEAGSVSVIVDAGRASVIVDAVADTILKVKLVRTVSIRVFQAHERSVSLPIDTDVTVRVTVETAVHVLGHVAFELVELNVVVGLLVVVPVVLDPAKQEHALESLEGEAEHGDAKAGIEGPRATVYV